MPAALDNGCRSPRKLLRAVVARLLGGERRAKLDPTVSEPNVTETERLALRRLTLNDLDALAAIYSDEDVRQYFPEGILTSEQTRDELEWISTSTTVSTGLGSGRPHSRRR